MSLMDTLLQQINNAKGDGGDAQPTGASTQLLGQSLTAMFRSEQTAPFASTVGQLFAQSNGAQRAGMLNHMLSMLGPGVLAQAGGSLGSMFGNGTSPLTPEQASQVSVSDVTALAAHAEQNHPGIVESMGHFYAQHPTLIKTLGSAALAIGLAKLREHQA